MLKGWTRGTRLYVNGRPGAIKRKRGAVWTFKYDDETRSVRVSPMDDNWCYALQKPVNRWPGYMAVIVVKKNLTPFVYKRESCGSWCGAATERTMVVDVPAWQIAGTNRLLVGHLGEYRIYSKSAFEPVTRYQPDVWIGRGQPRRTFRSLKVAEPNPPQEPERKPSAQLYEIPKREELSVVC